MLYLTLGVGLFVFVVVDSITALTLSGTVFQVHPMPIQNTLYIFALSVPFSNYFLRKETTTQALQRFFGLLFNTLSAGFCLYAMGVVLDLYVVRNTPPSYIKLQNPGDWVGHAVFRSIVLALCGIFNVGEIIYNTYEIAYMFAKESGYVPVTVEKPKIAKRVIRNKKDCDSENLDIARWDRAKTMAKESRLWAIYFAYMIFYVMVLFFTAVLYISVLANWGGETWQQMDSPHVVLIICIFLTWRIGSFTRGALVVFMFSYVAGVALSISYLFLEIERVNEDAQWRSYSSYEQLFNASMPYPRDSVSLRGMYSYTGFSEVAIDNFAYWSTFVHLFHAIFVAFGTGMFIVTTFVAIGLGWKGQKCKYFKH